MVFVRRIIVYNFIFIVIIWDFMNLIKKIITIFGLALITSYLLGRLRSTIFKTISIIITNNTFTERCQTTKKLYGRICRAIMIWLEWIKDPTAQFLYP